MGFASGGGGGGPACGSTAVDGVGNCPCKDLLGRLEYNAGGGMGAAATAAGAEAGTTSCSSTGSKIGGKCPGRVI